MRSLDLMSTERIMIRIGSGVEVVRVEERVRDGADIVVFATGNTTCAEAGRIECHLALGTVAT